MHASYHLSPHTLLIQLVMGSDQLSTLREPILLLSLTTRSADGTEDQRTYELNQAQLAAFKDKLDNINEVVRQMATA